MTTGGPAPVSPPLHSRPMDLGPVIRIIENVPAALPAERTPKPTAGLGAIDPYVRSVLALYPWRRPARRPRFEVA